MCLESNREEREDGVWFDFNTRGSEPTKSIPGIDSSISVRTERIKNLCASRAAPHVAAWPVPVFVQATTEASPSSTELPSLKEL